MRLAGFLLILALAGCALWQSPDPYDDKPGSFKHLEQLKQSVTEARRAGRQDEEAKRTERQFYERVRELRQHGQWLRENGHPGRAAAVEERLREILEN